VPTVEVRIWDIERIARTQLRYSEIEELLTRLKCEVEELRGDTLVYEASHDRPDLFSAEGLGRAIRTLKGVERGFKELTLGSSGVELIATEAPTYRPYVLMALVKGLSLDDEAIRQIFQLQEKLHSTYCGDRALVSIGLYDFSKVKPPIYYKSVSKYSFRPLDSSEVMGIEEILEKTEKGVRYRHLVRHGSYPLLVDSAGTVLSLPPIINSEDTRVTTGTSDVVIDVTGTDLDLMSRVLNVVVGALVERGANAEVLKVNVIGRGGVIESPQYSAREFYVRLGDVSRLLGINLSADDVVNYLGLMGINVKSVGSEYVVVRTPPYRIDIMHSVDLIEELAIAYGYDRLGAELLPPTHPGAIHPVEWVSKLFRDLMIGLGFNEVVNFMLIDSEYLSELGLSNYITIENPKMRSYSAVRNSLIPSILLALRANTTFMRGVRLFEVGDVVEVNGGEVRSVRKLSCAIASPETTLTDALVVLKSLLSTLGIKYSLKPYEHPVMISGRCGCVVVNEAAVGVVGEVHPRVLNYLGVSLPTAAIELSLSELIKYL